MSNCEVFDLLPVLEVEPHQVTEALRCLLHTIIFSRSLGVVRPREVDAELFDLTWAQCGDDAVDRQVDSRIAQVQSWADRSTGKCGQVCLSFYERRQQQGWFARQEQRLYWEQWCINLSVLESSAGFEERQALEAGSVRAQRRQRLQASLEQCIAAVVRTVNDRKDHIPPVVSGAAVTFPFDISLSSGESSSVVFGLDVVRRMLSSTSPPSVLH